MGKSGQIKEKGSELILAIRFCRKDGEGWERLDHLRDDDLSKNSTSNKYRLLYSDVGSGSLNFHSWGYC